MIKYDLNTISKLIPAVCDWLEAEENNILTCGRDLSSEEIKIAKIIGIKNYDLIRVYESASVTMPTNTILLALGKQVGLISDTTYGICFRYGIFINQNASDKKAVLVHELIHTLQYERFGSIESFITQYLTECFEAGYHNSALEKEACESSLSIITNP